MLTFEQSPDVGVRCARCIGKVQWCVSMRVCVVFLCPFLEEQLYHACMASCCCYMKRPLAVLIRHMHRCSFIQKEPHYFFRTSFHCRFSYVRCPFRQFFFL